MAADLKQVTEYVFGKDQKLYDSLSDEDKEKNFFIFNRMCSRLYPEIANAMNKKNIDKPAALDFWRNFFFSRTRPPRGFWGRKKKSKFKSEVPESRLKILRQMNKELWNNKLTEDDYRMLWHLDKEEVKLETKLYKESREG